MNTTITGERIFNLRSKCKFNMVAEFCYSVVSHKWGITMIRPQNSTLLICFRGGEIKEKKQKYDTITMGQMETFEANALL